MNRVFVHIEKVGSLGEKGDFLATVTDNYVEDIEVVLLSDPDLLTKEPHEIVKVLADKDGEVADVIQAAIDNGTDVYVNDEANMDHDAYRTLVGNNAPGMR
jgi:hypothetical protein